MLKRWAGPGPVGNAMLGSPLPHVTSLISDLVAYYGSFLSSFLFLVCNSLRPGRGDQFLILGNWRNHSGGCCLQGHTSKSQIRRSANCCCCFAHELPMPLILRETPFHATNLSQPRHACVYDLTGQWSLTTGLRLPAHFQLPCLPECHHLIGGT